MPLGRHHRLAGLALVLGAASGCRQAARPAVFPKAPVVLVSIDTLRSDRLPAYGYRGVETPQLDRLRRDAILFESAWSPYPMTLPSHVTMLTGLLPPEHGVRNNVGFGFDGRAHAHLPGLLKRHGYATGAAVSTYVLRGETGLAALFDSYEDSLDPRIGGGFAGQQRPGTLTAALAKAWIGEHAAAPFFYFFHIYEPHVPWDPPEPYKSRYENPYDGEVAAADAVVGQLIEFLRERGLYDRAIVIVTSDHGEGLMDHGEQQHGILLYREAIQVPLILKLPGGRRAGETVRRPVDLADVAPTIAELVGLPPPPTTSGRSLLHADGGEARALYAETLYPRLHLGWSELQSIVDGRFHYIHGPWPEIYDLSSDPGETRDLAALEPRILERMRAALGRVPTGPVAPSGVDPAVAERLSALGYLGTARDRPVGAPRPNPREMLPQLERMRQGFQLAADRRLDEAAELLAAVVSEAPANVEAWIKLGELQLELGRYQDAGTSFETALTRGGMELGDVRVELGYARLRDRQLDAATAAAERARASVPARALELLARIALARGRLPEAQAHAAAALAVRNPPLTAWLIGAELLTAAGDYPGALARLDEAERRAKSLGLESVYNLEALRADALARSGRPRVAEAAYRREATAFPGNLIAQANLAALLFADGRRQDALAVLDQMIAANPHQRARQVAVVTLEAVGEKASAARYKR
jgi:arylsulfatase A-like enzyme/tetratricopeptide (TPR) repeat protein